MHRPLYSRERPGTHCVGGWVGPRAGLDVCGKSRPPPTGIRSSDRPARSESLYRQSYPDPYWKCSIFLEFHYNSYNITPTNTIMISVYITWNHVSSHTTTHAVLETYSSLCLAWSVDSSSMTGLLTHSSLFLLQSELESFTIWRSCDRASW